MAIHESNCRGLAIICLFVMATACNPDVPAGGQEVSPVPKKPIEQVLREHTVRLISLSGVAGTAQGQCSDEPCIYVFVTESSPGLLDQIPSEIDGYQVKVQESGEFQAPPP